MASDILSLEGIAENKHRLILLFIRLDMFVMFSRVIDSR